MRRWMVIGCLSAAWLQGVAQTAPQRQRFDAFEVATVKPVEADASRGRMFRMDGPHRWTATDYTLKNLIALAYDLSPRTISGGPEWIEKEPFHIYSSGPSEFL